MNICFSGARKLAPTQRDHALAELANITIPAEQWHVGDAAGLDQLVRSYNPKATVHQIKGKQSWHFAERSQRMVDAVGAGGVLYAFPNKPCPPQCSPKQPFSGHGSGTWGSIAYASWCKQRVTNFLTRQCSCITIKLSRLRKEKAMGTMPVSSTESTLTERYQTTVPSAVRKALGLGKRDKICYTIQSNGDVLISRVDKEDKDLVCENFLKFLEQDMQNNPQRLQTISSDLVNRARSLVSDVEVNLDEPLLDEEE